MAQLKRYRIEPLFLSFVPALITGGPLFLALSRSSATPPSSNLALALGVAGYAGALALAIGLVVIFRMLVRQQREIEALRLQLDTSEDPLHRPR